MNRPSKHRKDRKGATAVEFAVVVPVIILLFMGSLEITRLNFLRHTASNAAYEAARACIIPGGSESDGIREASRLLKITKIDNGANINVQMTKDAVKVTIVIPVAKNSWGLGMFTRNMNLTQVYELQREIPQS